MPWRNLRLVVVAVVNASLVCVASVGVALGSRQSLPLPPSVPMAGPPPPAQENRVAKPVAPAAQTGQMQNVSGVVVVEVDFLPQVPPAQGTRPDSIAVGLSLPTAMSVTDRLVAFVPWLAIAIMAGYILCLFRLRRTLRMSEEETARVNQQIKVLRECIEDRKRLGKDPDAYHEELLRRLTASGQQGPQTEILLHSMNVFTQFTKNRFEAQEEANRDSHALVADLLQQFKDGQSKIISKLDLMTEQLEKLKTRVDALEGQGVGRPSMASQSPPARPASGHHETRSTAASKVDEKVNFVWYNLSPDTLRSGGDHAAGPKLAEARAVVKPQELRFYWFMGKSTTFQGHYEFWQISNDDDLLRHLGGHQSLDRPLVFARWYRDRGPTHHEGNLEVYPVPVTTGSLQTMEKRDLVTHMFRIVGEGASVAVINPAWFDIDAEPTTAGTSYPTFRASLRRKGEIYCEPTTEPSAAPSSRQSAASGPLDPQAVLSDYLRLVPGDPAGTGTAKTFIAKYQPKPGARGTVTLREGTLPQRAVLLSDPNDKAASLWVVDLRTGQSLAVLPPDAYRSGGGDATASTLRFNLDGIFAFQGEGQTVAALSKAALLTSIGNSDAATSFRIREMGLVDLK